MSLSKTQIKLLEKLNLGVWQLYRSVCPGTSISVIRALIEKGKLQAITLDFPETLAKENINDDRVSLSVRAFDENKDSWPTYIKKIDASYQDDDDNKISLLESQVRSLQEQIKLLTQRSSGTGR